MDADAGGDGWTCFGGTGVGSDTGGACRGRRASWIAAWAPGGDEMLLGSKTGYELEPGSRIIMQIHYNLLAVRASRSARTSPESGCASWTARRASRRCRPPCFPPRWSCPARRTRAGHCVSASCAVINVQERFGNQAGFTVAGLNLLCSKGTSCPRGDAVM